MGCTFDGTTKIITMTAGTLTLDVRDIYSRWKDWVITTGSGYLQAFSVVGGDPVDTSQGIYVTSYFFLENNWKVKPQEANHKLKVTNGVLVTSDGSDPFIQTTGTYNVLVQYSQPVKSETVATGGGSTDPWLTSVPGAYNPGTAGSILGSLRTYTINEGTALGGTLTSISLATTASSISETYTSLKVVIVSGTGSGQARMITAYNGTTKTATVDNWVTIPDETSVYAILPEGGGVGSGTGGSNAEEIWEYPDRTLTSKQARYDL